MDRNHLVNLLRQCLPQESILTESEDVKPFETDGLSAYKQLPWIVVLPTEESQVQAIMKVCHQNKIPVVARGSGTGLSGGALPHEQGVLLSLSKFTKIKNIDVLSRTAVVQPGVRNLAVSEAAAPLGLYYAPDPSSQIACSIGGNVAENSGGVHCLKYGLTVHNLLKVRVVSIEGDILEIGGESLDAAGYDLLALVTGSEGLLGVVTEVTVKLLPKPQLAKAILAAFDDVEKASSAVANIIAAGIIPAGLEMMDGPATRAAEAFVHANYPVDAQAVLICESDGTPEEVADEMDRMKAILESSGALELRYSQDEAQRLKFWAGRKAAFPAVGRLSPDYYCIDGTIPRKTLGYVLKRIYELGQEYGLEVANVFHAGDGNLHPLILFDAAKEGEFERTEAYAGKILELCVEVGGTITGEHGVGVEKINQMCSQFDDPTLTCFHGVKACFDQDGLLNPGKLIPTLHRCAELGRMHVHHNQLPHPHLPRF
ncbi:FAD-binding protein [Ferrovum sp. PN-J185]|uniref:FAD-linked oxidase C-terminal domain-containing protein n=1 Tax=Ferrovum sp. PN-J185 TaxID=1356306 RepID=UPI000793D36F|nr:FAD-linked oxidase C-terminal domain-containing protein [Ferrovum sp. PN-J185]KXW56894.1 putative FAD-linked oxidoreductase [Ferrovum sp. PN-J185]MCC6069238.1 FAD-binding protein [Ferrovum sp. PN-J185]MDE1891460.1 FAD-binding protein [Betaproteobacteria bacterium]MDE2056014.1 FAD-binding protein [Betaproteobacteria bacterium]